MKKYENTEKENEFNVEKLDVSIKRGLQDIKNGKVSLASKVFDDIERQYGF